MKIRFPKYPTRRVRSTALKLVSLAAAIVVVLICRIRDREAFQAYLDVFDRADGYFAAYFVDVGQGDATLLAAPDGSYMLIDCGPTDQADYLVKYLNDIGVQKLDYFILTHPHEDHCGGASEIIRNFPVEKFVIHADYLETFPYTRYIYQLGNNRFDEPTEIVGTRRDDRFIFADCAEFRILSPEEVDADDANESSLAIKIVYGNTSFLFTGDAEKGAERAMLANGYNLKADVFSAGHHGSATSNSPGFIEAVSPEFAVISCGKDNSYGHPHKKTLETFAKYGVTVLRTDELSNILLLSDGEEVWYFDENYAQTDGRPPENSVLTGAAGANEDLAA